MIQIYRDYIVAGGEIIDIYIDSPTELPAGGVIGSKRAALGSSAIDISTNTEFRLDGNGVWINQNTGEKVILITQQPESAEVVAGEDATFAVAASGYSLSYKWQSSSDGTTWTDISGATSASYTFTTTSADNGKSYHCIVTDGDSNTSTSSAAELTVSEPEQEPENEPSTEQEGGDDTEQNGEG